MSVFTQGAITLQVFVQLVLKRIATQVARNIAQAFTLGNGLVWLRNEAESCLKSLHKVCLFFSFTQFVILENVFILDLATVSSERVHVAVL